MKKNTFVVSVMAFAALMGIGSMFQPHTAEAIQRDPIVVADNSHDMNGMSMDGMKMEAAPATHRGTGTVKQIDAAKGMMILAHGPIASLNWPAMTMSFKLKDAALAKGIKAGDAVDFELIQSGSDYVVTRLRPSGK